MTTRAGLLDLARAGFRNQASIEIEPVEIQVCDGWAFSRNRVTGSVTLHDSGDVISIDVKELVVYSRDEQGAWRIARLIINSNTE